MRFHPNYFLVVYILLLLLSFVVVTCSRLSSFCAWVGVGVGWDGCWVVCRVIFMSNPTTVEVVLYVS